MIGEYLLKKVLDVSFDIAKAKAKKLINRKGVKLVATRDEIEDSLELHLRMIKNWSDEVTFKDIKRPKRISDIFIELDLYVYPRRMRIISEEKISNIPLYRIFDEGSHHIVLLGQPGAGKTTSMKYLCQLLLHDEEFQKDRFAFPVLIRFRDLNNIKITSESNFIADELYRIFGLRLEIPEDSKNQDAMPTGLSKSLREKVVFSFLEEFRTLLILDGFDELVKQESRDKAIHEIENFATRFEQCTMVITARTGEFFYKIDNTHEYELCPLNKDQVTKFAHRWLNDSKRASRFLKKIYQTPFADTAIRPLTLAHLCAIYERIDDIPEKPKTVYKRVVNLLLEEWDQQRSIKRESKYARFDVDRKYDFLCHLAYILTEGLLTTVFSTRDLMYVYKLIYEEYGLKSGEAKKVANEIEAHNGLFIQSGYEQFEFAHKSLQEFLTAEYLVKLPSIPHDWDTLMVLPNELAIAVAISSSPTAYFIELVMTRLKRSILSEDFIRIFLDRLLTEKPDFKTTILLGLCLLILYAHYIDLVVIKAGMRSVDSDPVFVGLEDLIKSHYTRSKIIEILNFYEIDRIYQTLGHDEIHRFSLIKNKDVPKYFNIDRADLPDQLLLRSSMFDYLLIQYKFLKT